MTENKNKPNTRGVSLKTPKDVMRLSEKIISDVFKDQGQIEYAGKVNNLLITFLKAWELCKIGDFEARLKALER